MQAIARVVSILQMVSRHPEGISLAQLSERLGLAKSTTLRFLQSLEAEAMLERKENSYRLGQRLIALAASVPQSRFIQAIAYPYLQELAEACEETVHLAVREGQNIRYIEQFDTPRRVQLETWLHQAYPLHLTAAGKALLAYAGEASIRAYLKQPLLAYTSKSMTDPDLLKQDLAATRLRGYAETQQEFSDEISSFAVGLFDRDQIVASISISIPVFRFPADGGQTMVQLLKETANLIQSHMRKEEKSGLAA